LKNVRTILINTLLLLCVAIAGCGKPTPVATVQDYLRMLSGEKPTSAAAIEAVTTENYRETEHPEIASITGENRERVLDRAEELRGDPAVRQYLNLVSWTTSYDVTSQTDTSAHVVARVILSERRQGDRMKALAIPNLPGSLGDILRRGLELPFQFDLKMEDGRWKIDGFTFPETLAPVFESFEKGVGGEGKASAEESAP
jgi:hypothetical protein